MFFASSIEAALHVCCTLATRRRDSTRDLLVVVLGGGGEGRGGGSEGGQREVEGGDEVGARALGGWRGRETCLSRDVRPASLLLK